MGPKSSDTSDLGARRFSAAIGYQILRSRRTVPNRCQFGRVKFNGGDENFGRKSVVKIVALGNESR
eukprot:8763257-Pyramimonas_sp.AAC.1